MNIFQYKAIDSTGRINVGKMDAANVADLEMRLQKMDLDLVNLKDLGPAGPKFSGGGVKRRDLIIFCFHLEQTSKAGVPILESLQDLRDSSDNPRLREILSAMYEAVEGGQTLSEAMSAYPLVFSEVFISLVKAGEQSGEISTIFFQLGESLKWQDEQASMTKKLLMYPLFRWHSRHWSDIFSYDLSGARIIKLYSEHGAGDPCSYKSTHFYVKYIC